MHVARMILTGRVNMEDGEVSVGSELTEEF